MVPVVVESPYGKRVDGSRASPEEVARNMRYLQAAMRDCFERGEAPFASHGLYPQALDDTVPAQRALGMEAGFTWGVFASKVAVYVDLGCTPGMRDGMRRAFSQNQRVELRSLKAWC